MIKARINHPEVEVAEGTTSILDAARSVSVKIPTLCKHPDLRATAACGICIVRNKGGQDPRACCTPLEKRHGDHHPRPGDRGRAQNRRGIDPLGTPTIARTAAATPSANCRTPCRGLQHPRGTLRQNRAPHCRKTPPPAPSSSTRRSASSAGAASRSARRCRTSGPCRSWSAASTPASPRPATSVCRDPPACKCGQCSAHCPTGAIVEHDETPESLGGPPRFQKSTASSRSPPPSASPSARPSGFAPGTNLSKKIYAALRRMGFKAVFDTNFGADLTIVEEASEFVERFAHGKGALPLITTCCPSWVDFMEKFHYDMIDNFSTAKSPARDGRRPGQDLLRPEKRP
jgi:hypothetical protein